MVNGATYIISRAKPVVSSPPPTGGLRLFCILHRLLSFLNFTFLITVILTSICQELQDSAKPILYLPAKKESTNVQAAQKTAARAVAVLLSSGDGVIELWLYTLADTIKAMTAGVIQL